MSQESSRASRHGNCPSKTWCFTLNNYTEKDEAFFADLDVTYIVYGKERGAPLPFYGPLDSNNVGLGCQAGTPHLQGYAIFRRAYRFLQINKLHDRCHWEPSKVKDAMNYCLKEQDYVIRDNRSQGKRSDFVQAAELITSCTNKRQMILDPRLFATYARYGSWCSDILAFKPPKKVDESTVVFRDWQKVLITLVKDPPSPRKIHWFYDERGGQGKSYMTNLLCRNYDAFLACGKKADCLYAYKDTLAETVIFDLTRSQGGEFCPYSCMETLKDGNFLSTKYKSVYVSRDGGCRLIVFANFRPDRSKMSEDRWDVHVLGSIF